VASVAASTFLLGLVYGFLFIGFAAFSDPTDPNAGLLNSTILVGLTLAKIQFGRAVDWVEVEEMVHEANRGMARQLKFKLKQMIRQARMAEMIHIQIVRNGEGNNSISDSHSSDSDSSGGHHEDDTGQTSNENE
jgi:hypothetical protein